MPHLDVKCVLEAGALNGECPRWRAEEKRLYWVDMREPALHRLDPATGDDESWPMPGWIGCYAFLEDGRLLLALRSGAHLFDISNRTLTPLAAAPYDRRRFCFNDGGCDRQGRFHAGPLYAPVDVDPAGPGDAPVWRLDEGAWKVATSPVRISNGLAWSPDGRTLYHADTARKMIWALHYDVITGEAEGPRVFAVVDAGGDIGGPDGAAVDRDGFYTCAVFGDGCLLRFDPAGRLERRIALPARYPTMPAYGGEELATLFVTSACFPIPEERRGDHPKDGALYALEAPAPGLPPTPFQPGADGTFR